MKKVLRLLPALAGVFLTLSAGADDYATGVINYTPGTGVPTGYTDPTVALGAPSRQTADPMFGTFPVDPFGPPYLTSQVVSVGAGGALTVQFGSPIQNNAANPYGRDFSIFGNTFFQLDNQTFTMATGAIGGQNPGQTTVSVSADGVTFYTLNPVFAPTVDGLFPTDGAGNFGRPVDPALTAASFTGRDLAGVRALYAGSGGGTSYDLAWAVDGNGTPVNLASASFVRVSVLSGLSEIDGFAVVTVPEPGAGWLALVGIGLWGWRRRQA